MSRYSTGCLLSIVIREYMTRLRRKIATRPDKVHLVPGTFWGFKYNIHMWSHFLSHPKIKTVSPYRQVGPKSAVQFMGQPDPSFSINYNAHKINSAWPVLAWLNWNLWSQAQYFLQGLTLARYWSPEGPNLGWCWGEPQRLSLAF